MGAFKKAKAGANELSSRMNQITAELQKRITNDL